MQNIHPHPIHPTSDFHKAGYLYLLFCWTLFLVYCLYYQTDQFLKTCFLRRRRRQLQRIVSSRKIDSTCMTPMDTFSDLFRPLEYTLTVPYVATMISIKHLICMTLFIIINALFVLYGPFTLHPYYKHYSLPPWGLLDRRASYVGMVNWSFAIVLGTRNSLLTRMSGLTFEALIPFHRWVSRVGLVEMLLHSFYRMYDGYFYNYKFWDIFFYTDEWTSGTISLLGYAILFVTSVNYIRRHHFRIFYYSHIFGYLFGTIFAFMHEVTCIYFFVPPVLLWILDRVLRSYYSWSQPAKLLELKEHHRKIVQATFEYSRAGLFRPGQYIFTTFLDKPKASWRQYADWYPMTISDVNFRQKNVDRKSSDRGSSSPSAAASIHIKALGDGTRQLMESVVRGQDLELRVDGPYGPRLRYRDYKVVALFAVGIGITPALTVLRDCIESSRRRSCVQRVYLTWSATHAEEVEPFVDYLVHCIRLPSPVELDLNIHLTRETDDAKCLRLSESLETCNIIIGKRPNIPDSIDKIADQVDHTSVWVHTCGSVQFMTTVINEAIRHRFDFHHETFEF